MIEKGGDYSFAGMEKGDRGWVFCPEYAGMEPLVISPTDWDTRVFLFGPSLMPDSDFRRDSIVPPRNGDMQGLLGPRLGNWLKQFSLPSHSDQALMGFAQLREVTEQARDLLAPRFRFQHVLTDETIEALDVLHRHRLVEDVHRLGTHAGHLHEPRVIFRVARRSAKATLLDLLPQPIHILQATQIVCNRPFGWRNTVDLCYLAVPSEVQDDGNREQLVGILIVKTCQ